MCFQIRLGPSDPIGVRPHLPSSEGNDLLSMVFGALQPCTPWSQFSVKHRAGRSRRLSHIPRSPDHHNPRSHPHKNHVEHHHCNPVEQDQKGYPEKGHGYTFFGNLCGPCRGGHRVLQGAAILHHSSSSPTLSSYSKMSLFYFKICTPMKGTG